MTSSNKLKLGATLLLLLVVAGIFVFKNMYAFLAITHRKEAGILVVEGWVPVYDLLQAAQEFQQGHYQQMVIASILLPAEFEMYGGGGLIFDLTSAHRFSPEKVKQVSVRAYSTPVENRYAHFKLIVNDSIVGEATTGPALAAYTFDVSRFPEPVRRIIVKFDNDSHTKTEDRNLYVLSLSADEQLFPARSPDVLYDRSKIDGKKTERTDFFSEAEAARDILVKAGIPENSMVVINAPDVPYDRTYTSALAVKHWMEKQYEKYPAFNIFTESVHARRTLMLYQMAFDKQANIGIIASPSPDFTPGNWWKVRAGRRFVSEQVLKYLYAKFLFYPS